MEQPNNDDPLLRNMPYNTTQLMSTLLRIAINIIQRTPVRPHSWNIDDLRDILNKLRTAILNDNTSGMENGIAELAYMSRELIGEDLADRENQSKRLGRRPNAATLYMNSSRGLHVNYDMPFLADTSPFESTRGRSAINYYNSDYALTPLSLGEPDRYGHVLYEPRYFMDASSGSSSRGSGRNNSRVRFHEQTLEQGIRDWDLNSNFTSGGLHGMELRADFIKTLYQLIWLLRTTYGISDGDNNMEYLRHTYYSLDKEYAFVTDNVQHIAQEVRRRRQHQINQNLMLNNGGGSKREPSLLRRAFSAPKLMEGGGMRQFNMYRRGLLNRVGRGRHNSDTSEREPTAITDEFAVYNPTPEFDRRLAILAKQNEFRQMYEHAKRSGNREAASRLTADMRAFVVDTGGAIPELAVSQQRQSIWPYDNLQALPNGINTRRFLTDESVRDDRTRATPPVELKTVFPARSRPRVQSRHLQQQRRRQQLRRQEHQQQEEYRRQRQQQRRRQQ